MPLKKASPATQHVAIEKNLKKVKIAYEKLQVLHKNESKHAGRASKQIKTKHLT